MSFYSNEVLSKLSTLTLYRILIKNMKFYPSKKKFEVLLSIKEGKHFLKKIEKSIFFSICRLEFRKNKSITEEKLIIIEKKKARMGVAHVMLFNEKMKELQDNYRIKDSGFVESLNPRDKDFIYF